MLKTNNLASLNRRHKITAKSIGGKLPFAPKPANFQFNFSNQIINKAANQNNPSAKINLSPSPNGKVTFSHYAPEGKKLLPDGGQSFSPSMLTHWLRHALPMGGFYSGLVEGKRGFGFYDPKSGIMYLNVGSSGLDITNYKNNARFLGEENQHGRDKFNGVVYDGHDGVREQYAHLVADETLEAWNLENFLQGNSTGGGLSADQWRNRNLSSPVVESGTADASQLRPDDVQPIVPAAIYAAVAIGGALGYTTGVGNGNPIEGLKTIARGEDNLSVSISQAAKDGLEFSAKEYPEETKVVLDSLAKVNEGVDAVITYVDDKTNVVTVSKEAWDSMPEDARLLISGTGKILSVVVSGAGALKVIENASTITKASKVLEAGGLAIEDGRIVNKIDYSVIKNPDNVMPNKDFTLRQKNEALELNKNINNGIVRSDISGEILVKPEKSQLGVTPDPNEWQFDHITPKSCEGTNCSSNLQIISREENRIKSNKIDNGISE